MIGWLVVGVVTIATLIITVVVVGSLDVAVVVIVAEGSIVVAEITGWLVIVAGWSVEGVVWLVEGVVWLVEGVVWLVEGVVWLVESVGGSIVVVGWETTPDVSVEDNRIVEVVVVVVLAEAGLAAVVLTRIGALKVTRFESGGRELGVGEKAARKDVTLFEDRVRVFDADGLVIVAILKLRQR